MNPIFVLMYRLISVKLSLFLLVAILFMASCQSTDNKGENNGETQNEKSSHVASGKIEQLTETIQQHPDSASLYFERGKLRIETKDYKKGEIDLKKAIDLKPKVSLYYATLGQTYLDEEFRDSAMKYFSASLKVDPKNRVARLQKAFLLWLRNDYEGTLSQTDSLLEHYPKSPKALGLRSQVYEAQGNIDKAIKVMKKALQIEPLGYDAMMRMGDLLLKKNSGKAIRFYEKAAQMDSSAAEPYYCIGLIKEKQGQKAEATIYYNKAIQHNAQFVFTYFHLGKLYEDEQDWEKARKIYTLATRVAPTSSKAYYMRGKMEAHVGKIEEAIADYRQALVFDENNKKAKAALEKIKE